LLFSLFTVLVIVAFSPCLHRWYAVSQQTLIAHGGRGLLSRYKGSLPALLLAVFPDYPWSPLRFAKKPTNFWSDLSNQRHLLMEVAQKIGIDMGKEEEKEREKEKEKWYSVSTRRFIEAGGEVLLKKYQGSLYYLLSAVFPGTFWDPLRFVKVPHKYWEEPRHQRAFMDALALKLGFSPSEFDRWYKVPLRVVIANGGRGLLAQQGNSLSRLLQSVYPTHSWDVARFDKVPHNHWTSLSHQRAFLSELAVKVGMKEGDMEEWYSVTQQLLIDHGGAGVLAQHRYSIPTLLKAVYPDYPWQLWRFPRTTSLIRNDQGALIAMLKTVEQELNIATPKEWMRVTREQLTAAKVAHIFKGAHADVVGALRKLYPSETWDERTLFGGQ